MSTTAHHEQANLAIVQVGLLCGYVLDSVPYGYFTDPPPESASRLAHAHAAVLGFKQLHAAPEQEPKAESAAQLALALHTLAQDQPLPNLLLRTLQTQHPLQSCEVVIRTDGSADKLDGSLSLGYLLGQRPYGVLLRGVQGNESIAEREAIRLALTHARLLGYSTFEVLSDHKFHVRRYNENLVHRGRRKSDSLERLDALVDELGSAIAFEYHPTRATDAPHRMALFAKALDRLAHQKTLSRAQAAAIRRVHFALKAGGTVLF